MTLSTTGLPHVTLVLGGARSGKSRYAEDLVTALPAPWVYIATAQAYDDEMRNRIAEHRTRRTEGWSTHDTAIGLASALVKAPASAPVLVDCLTLWLTNLMLCNHDIGQATAGLMQSLAKRTALTVLVSNEVGMGIVPDNALARQFRDEAGRLNQRMAQASSRVVFVAAGLPLVMKGSPL